MWSGNARASNCVTVSVIVNVMPEQKACCMKTHEPFLPLPHRSAVKVPDRRQASSLHLNLHCYKTQAERNSGVIRMWFSPLARFDADPTRGTHTIAERTVLDRD